MPWSGSGTFTRIYSWVADDAASINITASRMDADTNDIVNNGLNNCLTRDGQGKPSANLPMQGFRHTGVGNGVARSDYASLGQVEDGLIYWSPAGGTADALTTTHSPPLTVLVDGQLQFVRALLSNLTTTPTYSPDGLAAATITKNGGAALAAGDIAGPGHELILKYNLIGNLWELLNPKASAGGAVTGGSVAGASRNLKIIQASTTTATVSWDEVVAETSLNGNVYKSGSFGPSTLNFATTGANGLDTGALAVSLFYSIYSIYNPTSLTWATLACKTSDSSSTIYSGTHLPAGYTASALIGVMLSDASSHLLVTTQYDREVFYQTPVNIFTGLTGPAANTLTSQSISAAVPAIAKTVSGLIGASSGGSTSMAVAGDATGYGAWAARDTSATNAITLWGFSATPPEWRNVPLITSQTIYWATGAANQTNCRMSVTGFTF